MGVVECRHSVVEKERERLFHVGVKWIILTIYCVGY